MKSSSHTYIHRVLCCAVQHRSSNFLYCSFIFHMYIVLSHMWRSHVTDFYSLDTTWFWRQRTLQRIATHCKTMCHYNTVLHFKYHLVFGVNFGATIDQQQHCVHVSFSWRYHQRREALCVAVGLQWGCSVLQCVAVCCNVLQCVAVCCSVLQGVTMSFLRHYTQRRKLWCVAVCCSTSVCCSVLQCVAVWGNVLQCVAVCCNALQCVAVCCSVLQCGAMCGSVLSPTLPSAAWSPVCCSALQRLSVLQCVAVCAVCCSVCGVLRCVAVCCNDLSPTLPSVARSSAIAYEQFSTY